MAKNLYNLTAVTTVNDSDLLHVNQGSVSSDKKVTKQNLLKEVNSSITSLNNSLTQITNGNVTWNSTNVTGDQTRRAWQKIGRLVIANLEFTPNSGKIVNDTPICTDLPAPANANYAVFGGNKQQVKLDDYGKLVWYFPSDTTTLNRIELLLVYFSAT